jgi:3-carboxy-cis,cis-muconate cycloisomerase
MSPPTDVGLLAPVWAGTTAESLTSDDAFVQAMLRVEAGLLSALAATGLAPSSVGEAAAAVAGLTFDARDLALSAVAGGNPVIPLVDLVRTAVPDDVASHVHRGATSQDVLDTAMVLVASAVCRQVESDLTSLAAFLARLSDTARSVPAVARTLSQQALPTTLGMRASGWLAGVHDAIRVVRTCTTLPVSLGGPVGTAAAFGADGPAVVDAFADALGQRAPVGSWHTRRTPVVGLATAMTVTAAACAKIAADVLVMSQTEVGEAREGGGGSSSSMAHKANPAQSVLVVSAARQVPALTAVVASSAFPEQERPAGAWHAEWQPLRSALRLAGGAAQRSASYLPEVVFDHDAMAANLARLTATLGEDDRWVAAQTAHVGVWIDRVLAQHEEVCGS